MPIAASPSCLIILAQSALHREAWRALLSGQSDIQVSGAVGDPSRVAALLLRDRHGAILIDMPAPTPDLVHHLRTTAPDCGLLFLVPSYDLETIMPLLQAGATGFVSREDSVDDLVRGITAAARGELVLPPATAGRALAALAHGEPVTTHSGRPPGSGLAERLSEREVEVLRVLAQGLTNKDIAQTLILSVRTVEAHLRTIFGKLGVRSRTEAALWAVKHGYGPVE